MVGATSSITSGANSSVTPIHQNLSSTSKPIQQSSGESSNKRSRGQILSEKIKKMFENCRNKRIDRKLPKVETVPN